MTRDIVKRYFWNPVLAKAEIPYPVETVHNATVVKRGDEHAMLLRSLAGAGFEATTSGLPIVDHLFDYLWTQAYGG